jgi:hypothetical protein
MVEVLVASMFRHDGAYVRVGQRIMMTPRDAADYKALHFVQLIDPGNPNRDMRAAPYEPTRSYPGRGNGRAHVRAKP